MTKRTSSKLCHFFTLLGLTVAPAEALYAETFLTVEEAKKVLWQDTAMRKMNVTLTGEQVDSIEDASHANVSRKEINAWKTHDGGWFIVDQVVGKHEFIDIAVAISPLGQIRGVEVLTYRETYGGQVRNPKWLAQFLGRTKNKILKLDKDIKNISGATLSCRNITDGMNRLMHTWDIVLKHI